MSQHRLLLSVWLDFRTMRGHPYEGDALSQLLDWEHNFKTTPFELLGLWDWSMRGRGAGGAGLRVGRGVRGAASPNCAKDPRFEQRRHFAHEVGVNAHAVSPAAQLDFTRRLDRMKPGWGVRLSSVLFALWGYCYRKEVWTLTDSTCC